MNQPVSADERNWAMFANLAGLLIFSHIPFANVIGPLLVYLKARGDNLTFALAHARNALNFQITFSLFAVLAGIFFAICFFLVIAQLVTLGGHVRDAGPPLATFVCIVAGLAVWVVALFANVTLSILGAIAASQERAFRYPAIAFVR